MVRSDNWPHLHSYDPQQLLPPYAKWYLSNNVKDRSETYPKHLLEQVNKSRNGQHVTSLGVWGGNNNIANSGGINNINNMTQEEKLQYVMMQSMETGTGTGTGIGGGGGGTMANQDPELAHALALSMNAYNGNNNGNNNGNTMNVDNNDGDDDDDDNDALLQQALAMSMEQDNDNNDNTDNKPIKNEDEPKVEEDKKMEIVEEPSENEENTCIIQLRLPQNKRIERRFKKDHKLADVSNFVKSKVK